MHFFNRKNKEKNMSEETKEPIENEKEIESQNPINSGSESDPEIQIAALQKQVEEQKDKFLRLYADFTRTTLW